MFKGMERSLLALSLEMDGQERCIPARPLPSKSARVRCCTLLRPSEGRVQYIFDCDWSSFVF